MLKPSQIRKGHIYKSKFYIDGEMFNTKELCIGKTKTDIFFFLIDELPCYNKKNMRKILKLTTKDLINSIPFFIDEDIDEQIVISERKMYKEFDDEPEIEVLFTCYGDIKEVIKQIGVFK